MGWTKEEGLEAEVLKKYIYGGHVAEYMEEMEEEDPEKYNRCGRGGREGGEGAGGCWKRGTFRLEYSSTTLGCMAIFCQGSFVCVRDRLLLGKLLKLVPVLHMLMPTMFPS